MGIGDGSLHHTLRELVSTSRAVVVPPRGLSSLHLSTYQLGVGILFALPPPARLAA